MWDGECASVHTEVREHVQEEVVSFFFHHVCPGHWTQVVRPGGKYLYSLNHSTGPLFQNFYMKFTQRLSKGRKQRPLTKAVAWGGLSVAPPCSLTGISIAQARVRDQGGQVGCCGADTLACCELNTVFSR